MRFTRAIALKATAIAVAFCATPIPASSQSIAQCGAQGVAQATLSPSDSVGNFTSDHFGWVTAWGCLTFHPNLMLNARVTENGYDVVNETFADGPPAEVGASVEKILNLVTCNGLWRGFTKLGAPFPFASDWFAAGSSAPAYPSCLPPPPPPPRCGGVVTATQTFLLDATGVPHQLDHGISHGLSHWEARSDGFYTMDQWAMITLSRGTPRITLASGHAFRGYLEARPPGGIAHRVLDKLANPALPNTEQLLIQAPIHPHNSRYIPMPTLEPVQVTLAAASPSVSPGEGAYWFRAEVSRGGRADRVLILRAPHGKLTDEVREALRANLQLQYADKRRHRAIVFGVARIDGAGELSVSGGLVVLPYCCCGTQHCI